MADIHVMRDDLLPPKQGERRHLVSIADLTRDDVSRLLATARSFERSLEREVKKLPTLRGRTIVNLFYESSTRTSSSFELAAKRLSADTLTVKSVGSSVEISSTPSASSTSTSSTWTRSPREVGRFLPT